MADDVILNVDAPKVDAPVTVEFNGVGIIQSIEGGLKKLHDSVKSGSDEVLTAIFLCGMFVVAGLYLWRRV